jgi:two-component system, OmpR family, KDP operon response regulator KdpE
MGQKSRILIVEDEPKVVSLVREVLGAAGYDVSAVFNGENAVGQIALDQPDLVILDIRLAGGMDGYAVAKRVREFSEVPIIMLTGRAKDGDVLHGFETGADDYITKPFNSRELLMRIYAVLRRTQRAASTPVAESEILCGGLRIDLARRKVTVEGREVHLTPTEYNLLHVLASHSNQVMMHEQLLSAVWGTEYQNDVDYLRAYIHTLRQKLEVDPNAPKLIQRCPGVGYVLVCNETEDDVCNS